MNTTELATRDEGTIAVAAPRVTPETIQETMQTIALLQGMVKDTLIRSIDYGRIPGTPQDSLWDPGASQIISSFNCYPGERRILKLDDTDEKIVVCIEVPIISRATQQVVGSGIGAASTLETKYKYRWVNKPQEYGYDEVAIKTFKTKLGKDDEGRKITLYRIPNPEHSELLNTILKMASKRAEVDAAESLPGVASVLRQMFSGKPFRKGELPPEEEYTGPRWQRFWGEVRRLGMTDQEAHQKLGVPSMKDWLASGRSLDQAIEILRGKEISLDEEPVAVAESGEPAEADQKTAEEQGGGAGETASATAKGEETKKSRGKPAARRTSNQIKPEDVPDGFALEKVANEVWGLQPKDLWPDLNYRSVRNFDEAGVETAWDCFLKLKSVRG